MYSLFKFTFRPKTSIKLEITKLRIAKRYDVLKYHDFYENLDPAPEYIRIDQNHLVL